MAEHATAFLGPWSSYYVIVGSGSAALIGLMFVVITLVTDVEEIRRVPDGISTFSTPTIAHFSAVLFISAVMEAPWQLMIHPAITLIITGLYGTAYGGITMYRLRFGTVNYTPDAGDWLWYAILPFLAYVVILISALLLLNLPVSALFGIAAATMGMLFIGIRNAWDVVTFVALRMNR